MRLASCFGNVSKSLAIRTEDWLMCGIIMFAFLTIHDDKIFFTFYREISKVFAVRAEDG